MTTAIIAAAGYVASATLIIMGVINIRTGIQSRRNHTADEALAKAIAANDKAREQLAEVRQLAEKMRAHREWIEANPEKFRAALHSHLNGSRP